MNWKIIPSCNGEGSDIFDDTDNLVADMVKNEHAELIVESVNKMKEPDAELKPLREFARKVIGQECWGYNSMDGAEIEELAEKLGLIVPHIATEEDVNEESSFEIGDTIFVFSAIEVGDTIFGYSDILKGQNNEQ